MREFGKFVALSLNVEEIIRLYKENKSSEEIAKLFNCSGKTILNRLKENNIEIRGRSQKLYSFNENAFKTDTKEHLYIAGLLASDGCINRYKNVDSTRICFNVTDLELPLIIKKYLNSNHPIRIIHRKLYKTHKSCKVQYGITLTSSVAANDLEEKFNLTERKSLTLQFPERLIDSELIWHFIRGYSDGDGCFSARILKGNQQVSWSLCGTHNFLSIIREFINKKYLTPGAGYLRDRKNCSELAYFGKNQIRIIVNKLYENVEDLFLPRKLAKASLAFKEGEAPIGISISLDNLKQIDNKIFFTEDTQFRESRPSKKEE